MEREFMPHQSLSDGNLFSPLEHINTELSQSTVPLSTWIAVTFPGTKNQEQMCWALNKKTEITGYFVTCSKLILELTHN
jgi:hypothetical protein